jgi:hypothetical protein
VRFKRRNLEALGNLICGNLGSNDPRADGERSYFPYRSSMYITGFFRELDTDWIHDGSDLAACKVSVLSSRASALFADTARAPGVTDRVACVD